MIVAHEDSCPALCLYSAKPCSKHRSHECACHGAEKLRELVEAAEEAGDKVHSEYCTMLDTATCLRLDAALAPFREKP